MMRRSLRERGYAVAAGWIDLIDLDQVATTLTALIREESTHTDVDTRARVAAMDAAAVPHAGLLALRDAGARHMARTVDRAKLAPAIARLVHGASVQSLAAELLDVPPDRIGLSHPNLRADLPDHYDTERETFSLPWHQEGGYFRKSVSPTGSLVFWIALDDCGPEAGCLEVLEASHLAGALPHTQAYRDPINRRYSRMSVEEETLASRPGHPFPLHHCATRRGDVGIIDFLTVHRSGRNLTDKVRYTLLIRASNMFADDFEP